MTPTGTLQKRSALSKLARIDLHPLSSYRPGCASARRQVTNTVVPFLPRTLEQRSGVLCAVSSVASHRALPGPVAYSASKQAVTTFMDGLRMELHGSGVHAMTICPASSALRSPKASRAGSS